MCHMHMDFYVCVLGGGGAVGGCGCGIDYRATSYTGLETD